MHKTQANGLSLLLFCALLTPSILTFGQPYKATSFINPTGTYKLSYTIQGNDVYGPFGEVRAKLISGNRIVVSLFVCKGWPNYHDGTFTDTLVYANNTAIHKTPDTDTSCTITLVFKNNSVEVEQKQADINFGCEFGQGVFADGIYRKVSKKVPLMDDIVGDYFPVEKLVNRHRYNK